MLDKAVDFIRENKEDPFLVYLAPKMPHVELHAGDEFLGCSRQGLYGDVIHELDHYMGQLIAELKSLEIEENTYVIFASDNGPWLREGVNGGCAHPLRSGKVSTWEGGPRVPCIMWAPGNIPGGATCDEISTTMDVFATVVELAGASLPADRPVDGQSILHLLKGDWRL